MMKRNVLALLVPTLLVAGAANAAEIYNKDGNKFDINATAVGGYYISDDNVSDDDGENGDQSSVTVTFGFKGETQINDILTGYAEWEYEGQRFAGLKLAEYGTLDYGRNSSIAYDALAWTDVLPALGGDFVTDDGMTGDTDSVATYRNTDFFGLVDGWDFAAQSRGKDETRTSDSYGVSTSYTSPTGISIVGAYSSEDRANSSEDRAKFWGTALKYDANNVYLAASYAEGRNATPISGNITITGEAGKTTVTPVPAYAKKTEHTAFVAQYELDSGLRPSIAYVQTRGKDIEGVGAVDLVKYFEVGATYEFNKNVSAYVDYMVNIIGDGNEMGKTSGDAVALGLVYQF
jgi:outer membrane pore protein F